MTLGPHIAQRDLALHEMQGLPEETEEEVRSHLADCVLCRWQLAEVSGDLALLGLTPMRPVPVETRKRFLEQLAAGRPAADTTMEREQPLRQQTVQEKEEEFEQNDSNQPIREHWSSTVEPASAGERRRTRPGTRPWIPWVIAACLAIATAALAVQNAALNDTVSTESSLVTNLAVKASRAQQVLETLTSQRAQRVVLTSGKTPEQPAGRITYLSDRGGLIFQATSMKPIPPQKAYALWLVPADGGAPIPAGLFRPDAVGSAGVVLPPLPSGVRAKAFEVTVEDAAGAAKPSTPPLLSGNVSGA